MSTMQTQGVARRCKGSEAVTAGIRVSVMPSYLPEQSDPFERRYLFGYRIRIANEGTAAATLVSRRWLIVDAHGESDEVVGEGVVGQQPRIEPGGTYEYSSFCPLRTEWGTMEGAYTMRRDSVPGVPGELFEAKIARFYLVKPDGGR